ncbi:transposon ty3-G gag-pol polyprotein [Tanacetum coccineum]
MSFWGTQSGVSGTFYNWRGVVTDPSKIQAMADWLIPQIVKQLRVFLGLTGYYRRFVRQYAIISKPLTRLLKKNAFELDEATQIAFTELKQAITQALVLALPNFQKTFVVETNASGLGIGVVLQHEGDPIAYLSKTLYLKHKSLSTYEKEFLVVLLTLEKWRGYLLDRHFKIKTYHFNLKYLLDQRPTTPFQTKWLPKLLGYEQDSAAEEKIQQLTNGTYNGDKYTWEGSVLKRKGKIVVGNDELLETTIIRHYHANAVGGHSGTNVTSHKIGTLFYWKGMHKGVKRVDGLLTIEPEAILDGRMAKLNNKVVVYVLVKWINHSDEDATWELYDDLIQRFLDFQMDF